ncbi:MAG: hypothetical protein ABJF11_04635 [Reichenbachiella sp.]|uniref:hypothetical protein n=1 Tax=Reichenbachiella sp. TaxID=2184521 RepID=UPI003264F7AA
MKNSIITFLIAWLAFGAVHGQGIETNKKSNSSKEEVIHVREHVMVVMKDGTQVEAVVLGRYSNNKYWVRAIGTDKQGAVHKKYLIPISSQVSIKENKGGSSKK